MIKLTKKEIYEIATVLQYKLQEGYKRGYVHIEGYIMFDTIGNERLYIDTNFTPQYTTDLELYSYSLSTGKYTIKEINELLLANIPQEIYYN